MRLSRPLVLASVSPRRKALLEQAGVELQVVAPAADAEGIEVDDAVVMAKLRALAKAGSVRGSVGTALVLAADTLVECGGRIHGKPADLEDAARMLGALQGKTHQVITGVALLEAPAGAQVMFHAVSQVTIRPLTGDEIRAYHARVSPLDKAGAYALQEGGEEFVEKVEGLRSNVVGLPVERVLRELERWKA